MWLSIAVHYINVTVNRLLAQSYNDGKWYANNINITLLDMHIIAHLQDE